MKGTTTTIDGNTHVHTAQALHRIKCEAEEEEWRRSKKGISTTQKSLFCCAERIEGWKWNINTDTDTCSRSQTRMQLINIAGKGWEGGLEWEGWRLGLHQVLVCVCEKEISQFLWMCACFLKKWNFYAIFECFLTLFAWNFKIYATFTWYFTNSRENPSKTSL